MREIIPAVYTWSWLSPKHGYEFNGYAFESDDGLIVIDPAIMGENDLDELLKLGNPEAVILTNKDHERLAYELREKSGAKIYINERDSAFLKSPPDGAFQDGEIIPGDLRAINIPNNKSPGETALLLSRGQWHSLYRGCYNRVAERGIFHYFLLESTKIHKWQRNQ